MGTVSLWLFARPDRQIRVLSEGLSRAAEVMRSTALAAVMAPGATELDIARRHEEFVDRIAPLLGPMLQDMMFFHLRHMMLETEAVTASERADGRPLPGAGKRKCKGINNEVELSRVRRAAAEDNHATASTLR